MKRFILFLLLFFFILGLEGRACAECGKSITVNAVDHQRLKSKAHEVKAYCVSKGFSTNYCFLVDFSIHSGKKRFFVWDFKGDSMPQPVVREHGAVHRRTAVPGCCPLLLRLTRGREEQQQRAGAARLGYKLPYA